MNSESARVLSAAPVAASSRSLSTARSVLRVLSQLIEHPDGVRADEVADALGKSVSTAYYLLTSLCEEGFAVHESKGLYRPARGLEALTSAAMEGRPLDAGVQAAVEQLFLTTRKRSYLGVVRSGKIEIVAVRGRQGVPRIPGLGSEIRDSAHALAMGKVVLSLLKPRSLAHYVDRGLRRYTPRTISSGDVLLAELARVHEDGYVDDRAPVRRGARRARAVADRRRPPRRRGRLAGAAGPSGAGFVRDGELQAHRKKPSFLRQTSQRPSLRRKAGKRSGIATAARGNQSRSKG